MATDDRKRRIQEHLARSSGGMDYSIEKKKNKATVTSTFSTPTRPSESAPLTSTPVVKSTPEELPVTKPEPDTFSVPSPSIPSPPTKTTKIPSRKSFSTSDWKQFALGDRKSQIMSHLRSSSDNFKDYALDEKKKKQKIMDHVKRSTQG